MAATKQVAAMTDSADTDLLALAHESRQMSEQIDAASSDPTKTLYVETIKRLGQLYDEILATPSKTVEGLRAKARLACWARLGDLDYSDGWSDGGDMAWSIVRDLIRAHDPHLERPGAMSTLLREAGRIDRN